MYQSLFQFSNCFSTRNMRLERMEDIIFRNRSNIDAISDGLIFLDMIDDHPGAVDSFVGKLQAMQALSVHCFSSVEWGKEEALILEFVTLKQIQESSRIELSINHLGDREMLIPALSIYPIIEWVDFISAGRNYKVDLTTNSKLGLVNIDLKIELFYMKNFKRSVGYFRNWSLTSERLHFLSQRIEYLNSHSKKNYNLSLKNEDRDLGLLHFNFSIIENQ